MPLKQPIRKGVFYLFIFLLFPLFQHENVPIIAEVYADKIRESVLAGTWYPGDPGELSEQVTYFLKAVPPKTHPGKLISLIVPHAGYRYSGQIAAHAYKLLETQKFKTVVIIAPSHRARFSGVSVYDIGGYRTPFGTIPLDLELIHTIKSKDSGIRYIRKAHRSELSLEIQLPFIQMLLPEAKLVPLVMGDQQLQTSVSLAQTLYESIRGKSALIVASTDLSHFHSYEEAKKLDGRVMDRVAIMDAEGLHADLTFGLGEACGGGPMIAALLAAKQLGADQSEVLFAANSGDVTGDRSRVVGYMAAALWESAMKPDRIGLNNEEKEILHSIARQSVEAILYGRKAQAVEMLPPRLKQIRGVFVTINKGDHLRGCMGCLSGNGTLVQTVSKMAVSAAFRDPRFPPIRREEWPQLSLEISVLSPLRKIASPDEIHIGTHGLYMKQGNRSGLLLPQVAERYGWNRIVFLEQTCRKAGLPEKSWKDPETDIFVFSAEIF